MAAEVTDRVATEQADAIAAAAGLISRAFQQRHKLLLCGNGGSAADCQHMAAELVGRLSRDRMRPGLPAIALTTDSSFLTAHANDFGFDGVFARQIEAIGTAGDVLLAISTSGSSRNVVAAVRRACSGGLKIVTLTGEGGPVTEGADVAIRVPATDVQLIQQAHLAIEHLICELIEQTLYP